MILPTLIVGLILGSCLEALKLASISLLTLTVSSDRQQQDLCACGYIIVIIIIIVNLIVGLRTAELELFVRDGVCENVLLMIVIRYSDCI